MRANGKAYYLEPQKHGWVDDGISGGTLTFLRYPNGDHDVLIRDAVGARSAREDGAMVVKAHGDDDNLVTIIVVYPLHVTEVYQLTLDASGQGLLIWSNLKNRVAPGGVTRGMTLVSNCSR